MAQTYIASFVGVAFGNNKSMAGIFNGSGSGRIVRVKRIWVLNNQTSAVIGVLTTFEARRSTAQSGGTAVTPVPYDTASENMPAQVASAHNGTVTSSASKLFRRWLWSNDEPTVSSATMDEFQLVLPFNCIFDAATGDADVEPFVLREGEGLDIRHTGSSTVGVVDILVEFTLASS